jgi:hypothetical protein
MHLSFIAWQWKLFKNRGVIVQGTSKPLASNQKRGKVGERNPESSKRTMTYASYLARAGTESPPAQKDLNTRTSFQAGL